MDQSYSDSQIKGPIKMSTFYWINQRRLGRCLVGPKRVRLMLGSTEGLKCELNVQLPVFPGFPCSWHGARIDGKLQCVISGCSCWVYGMGEQLLLNLIFNFTSFYHTYKQASPNTLDLRESE